MKEGSGIPPPLFPPCSFVRGVQRSLSTYNPMMDWIPVTDRLPPLGKNVLACSNLAVTYFVACVSPQDGKWHEASGGMTVQPITHWMPLPELPEGGAVV